MAQLTFPPGFLWGAATSAHQVEGQNVHSDWWAWEQAGRVKDRSGAACDQYRRFAEDFDLAASLGHNTHRFSIEWSRIEPAEGVWDDAALAHYVEVVRALRQRHLEPIITLHHFTTPQWLAARGSWANPKVVEHFAQFTRRVAAAVGSAVRYWVTINEPMVYLRMHYVQGLGPPGRQPFRDILKVIEHIIRAHAAAYHVLHDAARAGGWTVAVSVAKNLPVFVPCRGWWPLDHLMAGAAQRLFNTEFLNGLTEGRWSVPGVATWRIPEARSSLDYLGINFYGRQFIRTMRASTGLPAESCGLDHHRREAPEQTLMKWEVYPPAFTTTLLRAARFGLPILVTENGAWTAEDARRWRYITGYVTAMHRAMARGARIIGYCYWSLLDNFEWADGYGPRFGLVDVDFQTQERRVRDSARRYAEVCRTNQLSVEE